VKRAMFGRTWFLLAVGSFWQLKEDS